jgi:site-specific recombinase XerD
MTDQYFKDPRVLDRLHDGPLGTHMDAFAAWHSKQGYTRFTIKHRIRLVGALSSLMHRRGFSVKDLNEEITADFLDQKWSKHHIRRGDVATLQLLLKLLRQSEVIPAPMAEEDSSELGRTVHEFASYLAYERSLSQASLINYIPVIRRFLDERFGAHPMLLGEIGQADIAHFVLRYANILSRGRAKLMVTALRSFFRFLRLRGDISADLAGVVPTVANWRYATVPKWIPQEDVEKLLRSCDQTTIPGQRNHTILLLLARLGLRSGEVVNMTLDDINWEAGEIKVGGKSRRQDRLPLPKDVGEALASYLCHGRPRCSTRRVFVRMRAPVRGFVDSTAIYSMVRRAFDRAGLNPSHKGPHILRHSLATNMLRKGASLGEIGEVLRHRNLSTTQIYAKVDLEALSKIAQPWPGGEM